MNELEQLDGPALLATIALSWGDVMVAAFMAAPVAWTFLILAIVALSASVHELLEGKGTQATAWAFGFSTLFAIAVAVL